MGKKTTQFGKLCRSYRAKQGMNMTQAAQQLGVSQPTLTNYETGKESPSLEFITNSMKIYGIEDRKERMQFLFTAFESLEKIAISFKQLGPLGREWLAALVILYTIDHYDSKGWNELEEWLTGFVQKLKNTKPKFIIMGDPDHPI